MVVRSNVAKIVVDNQTSLMIIIYAVEIKPALIMMINITQLPEVVIRVQKLFHVKIVQWNHQILQISSSTHALLATSIYRDFRAIFGILD